MLTLSQPTLYYRDLSTDTAKKDGLINNWATAVSKLASLSRLTGHSCSDSRHTVRMTSQRSTTSKKNAPELSDDDAEYDQGAWSDNNETIGNERDAAVNSPPKNGVHATNSVRIPSLISYTYTTMIIRVL